MRLWPSQGTFRTGNRSSQHIRAKVVENQLFKEYFGVSATAALIVWKLLEEHNLIPKEGKFKHLLWTLVFLKVYVKQGPVCSLVGRTKGVVNPRTFCKWVWKFIFIFKLLDKVEVSLFFMLLSCRCQLLQCWFWVPNCTMLKCCIDMLATLPNLLPFFGIIYVCRYQICWQVIYLKRMRQWNPFFHFYNAIIGTLFNRI